MNRFFRKLCLGTVTTMLFAGAVFAADPDPKILGYTLPADIKWVDNAARTNQTSIIYGNPDKPGPYAMLIKWRPGNMSRPHFHEHDRFFVVLQGTWWVGTGPKFDPAITTAMPAGTLVTHFARGIHYDGAKDGECIIALHGMGPATSTPAEQK